MRSSKSRSRSKNNRSRSVGNIVNRVFDSSGPESKVRGTPQQIIDKYSQLARDAQLSNDRVAAENFQQHAEHYVRMLGEAQRDADARREAQEQQNRDRQRDRDDTRGPPQQQTPDAPSQSMPGEGEQPQVVAAAAPEPAQPERAPENAPADVVDMGPGHDTGLVETPESAPEKPVAKPRAPRKPRTRAKPAAKAEAVTQDAKPAGEQAPAKAETAPETAKPATETPDDGGPREAAE